MFQNIVKALGGDPHKREVQNMVPILERINLLEDEFEKLSADALRAKTDEFRRRQAAGESLDDLLPEAFAAVREASKRTIGLRHYDVQMIGGITLHRGNISEMRTGEGKTLVATLPLYLNALTGRGVHLVTVNDYLARRDARWMAPIYQTLGLSVGVLQMAARTENGRNAFLVDLSKTSPHEDQHQLQVVLRAEAYKADITYGTNSEFGFDYLRDNLTMSLQERVQRGHYYAIVDEVDNILIDEARTPLIISGPAADQAEWYIRMSQVVRQLQPDDYDINEKDRTVSLTEIGESHVEEILGETLRDPDRPEDITPEQAQKLGYLEQALRAQFLFNRNKDYLVQGGKVVIVDEFTGRLMPGRRWSDGLHQAVEAKENVKVEAENVTYATITLQNYFRMYEKLAGMTGTALTEAEEFYKIYKLDVLPIPTNLEFQASKANSPLEEITTKDEDGYKVAYFAHRGDPEKKPVYWRRKDYPDVVYRSEEAKLRAISLEIIERHIKGQPILVGTTSVEHSDLLGDRLRAEPVRTLLQAVLLRQVWLEKSNRQDEERNIPELEFLNAPLDQLKPPEMRQLARSLDLSMNMEEPANLDRLAAFFRIDENQRPRLLNVIQAGIPLSVLNARKHDEESQIIAKAGAFGAVTIATNMAGRGVDIKLGGELPEDILADVNHVLARTGLDPYGMNNEERRRELVKVPPADYGIYEESIKAFLQYMDDMERVRALGGLHVIGSERHEARRIDNQLRGRAARQGDPGSSRFYLSLNDDLMRLFGGPNVENLLKRLNIDESIPIESGMVGRMVEQSQERVEGSNFDVRKHLLEYDDVLNTQRKRIYSQRDMVFTKEDLSEDVMDMLHNELAVRIPAGLKDEEGPWRLLAYLEEIQPPLSYGDIHYPSFSFRLLVNEIRNQLPKGEVSLEKLKEILVNITERALAAEDEHLLHSLDTLLESTGGSLQTQIDERLETLDTYFDGIGEVEEGMPQRRPQELLDELVGLVRVPLRLPGDQLRRLAEADDDVKNGLRQQINSTLLAITATRVVGGLRRRLPEAAEIRLSLSPDDGWKEIANQVYAKTADLLALRKDRLFGSGAQVPHDVENLLGRTGGAELSDTFLINSLMTIATGSRMVFDKRTHRQVRQSTNRLNYVYFAAQLLGSVPAEKMTRMVLEHLEGAIDALRSAMGLAEWERLQQSNITLMQVDPAVQAKFIEALGEDRYKRSSNLPLADIDEDFKTTACEVIGARVQTEIYRHILLSVISDLWVEYLTKVEALRVSIGLEAYAQRDPLVQYKSKASEMFTQLLGDIRMGVISRMFAYQPRRAATPTGEAASAGDQTALDSTALTAQQSGGQKKKRRRH
jgi:preprotein translocase subunit SecA